MNAFAPAREPADDLAATHPPANAFERMLITQVEQSWARLQHAYETERRYCQGRNMVEIITTKLAEFKAITRYVTDSERAWRHAVLHLEKTQRRREREAQATAKIAQPRKHPTTPAPSKTPQQPTAPPPAVAVAHHCRE